MLGKPSHSTGGVKLENPHNKKYTRSLWLMIGITILAYFAAINREQNLPWIFAALMLAALITGYVLPHLMMRKLHLERTAPEQVFEGDDIELHISASNQSALPCMMVTVHDHLPFIQAASGDHRKKSHLLGLLPFIGRQAKASFKVHLRCEKRGVFQLGPPEVSSSFPLGFVNISKTLARNTHQLTVFPKLYPIKNLPLIGNPQELYRGEYILPRSKGNADFLALREYQYGDHPRHIHWPSSARLAKLIVKEFEPIANVHLHLILDCHVDFNVGKGHQSSFEDAMRIAASVSQFALSRQMRTAIYGHSKKAFTLQTGHDHAHFKESLLVYASAEPEGHMPYADVICNSSHHIQPGSTAILFLSTTQMHVPAVSQAISQLQARHIRLLAFVFDRQSYDKRDPHTDRMSAVLDEMSVASIGIHQSDHLANQLNA